MYFAISPNSPTLPTQIAQEIAALREQHSGAPMHVTALVDGAFDEQFFAAYPRSYWPRQSLYAGTSLQSLGAAAPQLTSFGSRSGEMETWLEKLFSECSGKPMLSIIASAIDSESLQRHLRPYLICRTDDTLEWPVRWGDARILPGLMEELPLEQHTHLMTPIFRWWTVGRSGERLAWNGDGEIDPAAASFDKLPMGEETFAALVDRSEADAVLNSIHDNQPDLLSAKNPLQAHETVSRSLDIATSYRIEAARARQHFSVLSLMIPGDLTKLPGMAEALSRVRSGSEYFREIAKLPPSFWEAAEEAHS